MWWASTRTKAEQVYLGVATTPDFPVDLAQRPVDNGWGAYDMF